MDLKLQGKKALVTGSDRGTGEIIAKTLAAEGVTVAFHSIKSGGSDTISKSVDNSVAVWGDISKEEGTLQVAQQALDSLGIVDILVNNYGTASQGFWTKSSSFDWIDMYQKNVLSAARLIQLLSPQMKKLKWGRIIQLGTIGSNQPNSIMPHYYASKSALANITVSLAKELSNTGITVNTISPGLIHTPEIEAGYRIRAQKKGWGKTWEKILENIVKYDFPNPVGRIACREEIADVVVFICSPRADYINGQNIRIDGGAVRYV